MKKISMYISKELLDTVDMELDKIYKIETRSEFIRKAIYNEIERSKKTNEKTKGRR